MYIKLAKPKKSITRVGNNSKEKHGNRAKLGDRDKVGGSEIDDNKVDNNNVAEEKNHQKISKFKKLFKPKKTKLCFFIFKTRLAFTKLKQAFVKVPIFYHFDPKCHIWIEMDVLSYVICGIFSQLALNNLGQ